ncbi:MAG: UDP-N-acetylmuramoyl-L-alanine--D-glutamate ligase [Oscillospiraceae bacterium]
MNQTPAQFFDSIRDKTVAFVGVGVSHNDTIRLFARQGIQTIVCDRRDAGQIGRELVEEFQALGVSLRLGEGYLNGMTADILFRTPGLYYNHPDLISFRSRGGIVTSELEVFFDLCPCPILAVTGSEGKTTTTTLISKILEADGKTVHLGGNIGRALLPRIFNIRPEDFACVELSSFQLISMRGAPDVSVITNITPDHLDVHASLQEYVDAKRNIYLHQNAFSRTVLGQDNDRTRTFLPEVRGEAMTFSLETPVYNGAYLAPDGMLTLSRFGRRFPLFHKDEIRLPGLHSVANYLAAICATANYADPQAAGEVARSFGGVEHRLEFVRELNGVRWYNDSIATAPAAVIAGLRAFGQKLILIGGGSDKHLSYDELAPELVAHTKLLLLSGPTGPKIADAVRRCPGYADSPEIVMVRDVAQGVEEASKRAQSGDVVTLSPASASFDAFLNFEERGRHYKELVNSL